MKTNKDSRKSGSAAKGAWSRASIQRDREREARILRNRAIERADDRAHVELYELVAGLARLLGRERAVAIVVTDLKELAELKDR